MTGWDAFTGASFTGDWIALQDYRIFVRIGVDEDERSSPQELRLDVYVEVDLKAAGSSDLISDTIDYSELESTILQVSQNSVRHTVEALAEDFAKSCLAVDRIKRVRVTLSKAALKSFSGFATVSIQRVPSDYR